MTTPQFPIRLIFDDGELVTIETPEDLIENVESIDSTNRETRVWIRDALDRNVRLRMHAGQIEIFEVEM